MFHLPIPINGNSNEPTQVIKRHSRGYDYNILKYDLNSIDNTDKNSEYTLLTNTDKTKVFAYIPPRQTINYSDFCNNYCENDKVELKDSVEGTLITFFWNSDTSEWNICTRNGVGCDYSYFRPANREDVPPKTFREMVLDVFRTKLDIENMLEEVIHINELNDVIELNTLSKTHCYTCILQHPENHIVYSSIPYCSFLKLICIYELNSIPPLVPIESDIYYNECLRELPSLNSNKMYLMELKTEDDDDIWKVGFRVFSRPSINVEYLNNIDDLLHFKKEVFKKYTIDNINNNGRISIYSDEISYRCEREGSLYYPPSWILTNTTTGHFCEIVNPFYEHAKKLRNFQPNMKYQYLELRKNNMIKDYLFTFPQYHVMFRNFEVEYNNFISEVYNAYVKFYIMKIRNEIIPKQYFVHAAKIHHNVYLKLKQLNLHDCSSENSVDLNQHPSTLYMLRAGTTQITRNIVEDYFNSFASTKMFYYLTHI